MTGATTVVWFRGKRRASTVSITKPDNLPERREAEQAVRESTVRGDQAASQRGVVARLAHSLAEVRERNHFAENIKTALGGDGS